MAGPARSQIAIGIHVSELMARAASPPLPILRAFGEPDDHLRLTVLLAHHLRPYADRLPPHKAAELREAADACMVSSTPWSSRRQSLEELLQLARKTQDRPFSLMMVDIDALNPGLDPESRWNDHDFRRQRRDLLDLFLGAIDKGGWLVLRPNPSRLVSQRLTRTTAETIRTPSTAASTGGKPGSPLQKITPEQRPILTWLLKREALAEDDVHELFEVGGPQGLQAHLVALAHNLLKPSARRAGETLSVLRPPQDINGMLGPFRLARTGEDEVVASVMEERVLPTRALSELEDCGFLVRERRVSEPGDQLRMPRFVRTHLQRHARARNLDGITAEHRWLGEQPIDAQSVPDRLETHFHAVQGGALDRATATALYYGADLRALGFQKSHLAAREGREQERRRLYTEAARIYEIIVRNFDASDAYAWEYLGYNLARAHPEREPVPEAARAEILNAYARAIGEDPDNPLYHGRLLAFRARLGENILGAFNERMSLYLELSGGRLDALSYFCEPVLNALDRSGRKEQREALEQQWPGIFDRIKRARHPSPEG